MAAVEMPPDMSVPTARSSGGRFRERPSAERHSRLRKAVPDPLPLPPGTLPGGPKAVPFKGKQLRWQQPGRFAGTGAAAETADFPSGLLRR